MEYTSFYFLTNLQALVDQMNGHVIMETALMKIGCVISEKIAEMEVMKNKIVSTTLVFY